MWTRIYLTLVVVRLYFALSPSYIHPDENFQGPEVIAGRLLPLCLCALGNIYGFPNLLTWEFTSEHPVRSVFPLWPTYGLPMVVLRWLWMGASTRALPPRVVYYTLRLLMFLVSFVLEDWAIHELVESPRHRRMAVILAASSYVTWTYQTHTFSNAIETVLVLWSLVLVQRVRESKQTTSVLASSLLGMLAVVGTFNRITFPAFLIGPFASLVPDLIKKFDPHASVWLCADLSRPMTAVLIALTGSMTLLAAVMTDTHFFRPSAEPWSTLLHHPVLAPYNALMYNIRSSNLAEHGLHPRYTHILANIPLLLAPAVPLLLRPILSMRLWCAISGLIALSILPHQEPRFLLPLIPLLLSSVHLPINNRLRRLWLIVWIGFNVVMGVMMGIFHQGGVVPTQLQLGSMTTSVVGLTPLLPPGSKALWWKTYSPPVWLANANGSALQTIDLMGMPAASAWQRLKDEIGSCSQQRKRRNAEVVLVAPRSRTELRTWVSLGGTSEVARGDEPGHPDNEPPVPYEQAMREAAQGIKQFPGITDYSWRKIHQEYRHIGLDDLDFAEDGVWGTLMRVIGQRGLQVWRVRRRC